MMNTWSIYRIDTGVFTGCGMTCNGEYLSDNVPDGCSCIVGEFDALSQRVDVTTGDVIDYQPPAPDTNYEWNPVAKRWRYVPTDDDVARDVRIERDVRLAACDWVSLRALDTSAPVPSQWIAYRQALRSLTDQAGFPHQVAWPDPPTDS